MFPLLKENSDIKFAELGNKFVAMMWTVTAEKRMLQYLLSRQNEELDVSCSFHIIMASHLVSQRIESGQLGQKYDPDVLVVNRTLVLKIQYKLLGQCLLIYQ